MSLANATLAVERATDTTQAGQRIEVETRFGRFEIDAANAIYMPKGPHGFADLHHYALLDIPGAEDGNFKLLQAIDDASVGFIVLPLAKTGGAVAEADLEQACRECGMDPETAAFLLLVTVRRGEDGTTGMTANLRAPILVDTASREARQHIFANADYPMRLPLQAG